MKRILVPSTAAIAAALALSVPDEAAAQTECTGPASPVRLYVIVENIRTAQGLIAVTLYTDDSRRFLARRSSLYVGRVPARAPRTRICIHLPSTGVYALGVYHDENGNRSYDRSGLGLPREGFGFSNNPATIVGIPSFRSVRIAVPRNNMQATVRLRYP